MAQRLAHEIKNPLTPIQLAVQECHRKYGGGDGGFRSLLDTTLEIVEEEVGTLRRLVGNFSSFARLPHAELRVESLRDFLRECAQQLGHLGAGVGDEGVEDGVDATAPTDRARAERSDRREGSTPADVDVRWDVPEEAVPVAIDRQMLRRVLVNLVRNAVESIRGASFSRADGRAGHVVVRSELRPPNVAVLVEDDGPGVAEAARERVFDPYFTTKPEGTGLGLAIVKKIVVEHNGSIATRASELLGGASFVLTLPVADSRSIAGVPHEEGNPLAPSRGTRRRSAG
jgi:two-component system nitrogen regulation sensor histidine kinase NtrY